MRYTKGYVYVTTLSPTAIAARDTTEPEPLPAKCTAGFYGVTATTCREASRSEADE